MLLGLASVESVMSQPFIFGFLDFRMRIVGLLRRGANFQGYSRPLRLQTTRVGNRIEQPEVDVSPAEMLTATAVFVRVRTAASFGVAS